MPLRDHFHPPLDDSRSWDELHGAWPTVIVMALNKSLPQRYVAAPRVQLEPHAEIDVTAYQSDTSDPPAACRWACEADARHFRAKGADVKARSNMGLTALGCARSMNHQGTVRRLQTAGADK